MFQYWYGVVTSASALTVNFSGPVSNVKELVEELSAGAGATWSIDKTGASSAPFPSLSPASTDEAYVGIAFAWADAAAGTTAGVSYDAVTNSFLTAIDPDVSGALSPNGTGAGALGLLIAASTTPSCSAGPFATPLLWGGQYYDSATGLYYLRARWYDPSTGQFLSVDPDFNTTLDAYGYGDDNPLDSTDWSGLKTCSPDRKNNYCGAHMTPQAPLTKVQRRAAKAAGTALGAEEVASKQLAADEVAFSVAYKECQAAGDSSPACVGGQSYGADHLKIQEDGIAVENAASDLAGASHDLNKAMGIPSSGSGGGVSGLVVGGLVAGLVSVVTGGLALVPAVGEGAAETLGFTSVLTGVVSTAVDADSCINGGSTEACASMGFGIASAISGTAGLILDSTGDTAADAVATAEQGLSLTGLVGKVTDAYGAFFGLDSLIVDSADAYVNRH